MFDDFFDILKTGVAGVIEGELRTRYPDEPVIMTEGQAGAPVPAAGQSAAPAQVVAGLDPRWLLAGAGVVAVLLVVLVARR